MGAYPLTVCEKRSTGQASLTGCRAGFLVFILLALNTLPRCEAQERQGPVVVQVSGAGASHVAELESLGRTLATVDSVSIAQYVQRIVDWYRRAGYLRATVDSVRIHADREQKTVMVHISEGRANAIRSVTLTGDPSAMRSIAGSINDLTGEPFSDDLLEGEIGRMLERLESLGYPMATVAVERLWFTSHGAHDSVDVVLHLDAGPDATLSEIAVEGNTETRTGVIVREARLSGEARYTPQLAERLRRRLVRLGLFAEVAEPELFFDRNRRAGLLIRVREGSPNRFDGMLGYVPSSATDGTGYLTGLLHVQLRNLFGTARQFEVRWYRESQSTQEVSLRYREPWLFGIPLFAAASLHQRQQDSAFVRQQVGLELEISLDDRWSVGVAVERMAIVPSDGFGTRTVPRSTVVNFGGRLRFDSRDDLVTPTSGFLYETSYRMGTKGTTSVAGASDRFTTQTATMDVAGYYAVAQRHVLAAAIHWGEKRTPTLDVSDLDRVGGASTLRGYREGQFFATRFIWGSFEYRLLAGQRSFLYAFLDGASLAVPGGRILGLSEQADTKFGYGVGIRVDSPVGLIGVSLALGAGDTFSTAKLHIRLINEF